MSNRSQPIFLNSSPHHSENHFLSYTKIHGIFYTLRQMEFDPGLGGIQLRRFSIVLNPETNIRKGGTSDALCYC